MPDTNLTTARLCNQAGYTVDAIEAALLAVNGIGIDDIRTPLTWLLECAEEQARAVHRAADELHKKGGAFERGIQRLREGG